MLISSRMHYQFLVVTLGDSARDELLVYVDGQDMRRKAAYAPFQGYTGEVYLPSLNSPLAVMPPTEEYADVDFAQSVPGKKNNCPGGEGAFWS